MVKKIFSVMMIVVLISLSLTGCFGQPKADESFAVPIMDEPTSLDPQIVDSNAEKLIVGNCFEGLMRISQSGELEPGVAESYTVSPDGLTYTFNLRHDAHWAMFSGHKNVLGDDYNKTFDINVYAQDFEFAFDRMFDKAINSPDADFFIAVSSYEAVDDYTFRITLSYRDDGFLYSLTLPCAMPCDEEFYNATGGKYGLDAKFILCNGPFNVSKWVENTSVRIVRNDDYNGENKVMPSSVTFYLNNDQTAVAEKIGAGTYDVAFLSNTQYNSIVDKDNIISTNVENAVYSLVLNQSDKYLSEINIRRAVASAVDTSLISVIGEDVKMANGIVPPFCKIGNESYITDTSIVKTLPFNAQSAKEYFEQGLLELGSSSVELEIKCTEQYQPFVQQLVQTLQKTLGVKFVVTVSVLSASEFTAAVNDGNYSIAFYPFTANSIRTSDFLESFGDKNIFGYSSTEFNAELTNIRRNSGNYSELRKYCEQAEEQLINDVVMIPVLYENSYFVTADDVQGIYFYSSKDNIFFINATKK